MKDDPIDQSGATPEDEPTEGTYGQGDFSPAAQRSKIRETQHIDPQGRSAYQIPRGEQQSDR